MIDAQPLDKVSAATINEAVCDNGTGMSVVRASDTETRRNLPGAGE
jgi:hypothetical protein